MTWFKVDDTLAAHSKTRKAGLPAMGLWVVAGSWSSQQLTEGFIPDWFVESWPRGKQYAANLVRAQLWFESNSGPERGYRFHDWTQCNPTAEQVKTERAAGAERQRRAREKAAQARAGSNRNAVTNGVTNGVSHGEVTADVTRESQRESRSPRPDPTRKELTTSPSTAPRPEVRELCEHLHRKITEHGSKATITQKWFDAARLMLDNDKRPLDEAHRLIDWCQADDFWHKNILSMPKFREQYDKLRLKATSPNGNGDSKWYAHPSGNGKQTFASGALMPWER